MDSTGKGLGPAAGYCEHDDEIPDFIKQRNFSIKWTTINSLRASNSRSSGLWRHVLLWQDTNVSCDPAASILKTEAAWIPDPVVPYHNTNTESQPTGIFTALRTLKLDTFSRTFTMDWVISWLIRTSHLPTKYSSLGIATRLWAGQSGTTVPYPAGAGNFSLHHRFQNCSEAQPASYPTCFPRSFPGGKATEAWSWPPPSSAEVKEWVELHLYSP
jgi:hypothetical protein